MQPFDAIYICELCHEIDPFLSFMNETIDLVMSQSLAALSETMFENLLAQNEMIQVWFHKADVCQKRSPPPTHLSSKGKAIKMVISK